MQPPSTRHYAKPETDRYHRSPNGDHCPPRRSAHLLAGAIQALIFLLFFLPATTLAQFSDTPAAPATGAAAHTPTAPVAPQAPTAPNAPQASPENPHQEPWINPTPAQPADPAATQTPATPRPLHAPRTGPNTAQSQPGEQNAETPSQVPESTRGFLPGGPTVQVIFALAIVLGLIVVLKKAGLRMAQGTAGPTPGSVVEVLTRVRLGLKTNALLIKVGHRVLVVAESPAGLQTLATIDQPDELAWILQNVEAAQTGSISQSFSQWVGKFDLGYRNSKAGHDADKSPSGRLPGNGRQTAGRTGATRTHARGAAGQGRSQAGDDLPDTELQQRLSSLRRKLNVDA